MVYYNIDAFKYKNTFILFHRKYTVKNLNNFILYKNKTRILVYNNEQTLLFSISAYFI
jgi:hypothetical protein